MSEKRFIIATTIIFLCLAASLAVQTAGVVIQLTRIGEEKQEEEPDFRRMAIDYVREYRGNFKVVDVRWEYVRDTKVYFEAIYIIGGRREKVCENFYKFNTGWAHLNDKPWGEIPEG